MTSLGHVLQQSLRRLTPLATKRFAPLRQTVPGRVVAVVLEGVHQFAEPLLARLRRLAENDATRLLGVVLQVIEVQADVWVKP